MVSTIIPVFNRPRLLKEAVASVLAQTYRPIEVIIVDDGSTDDTPSVCALLQIAQRDVIHWVRQANAGPGVARETGRRIARGEFIQYLDSDDLLHPRKFELQTAALHAHPECGVAYCYTRHYRLGAVPVDRPWKGSGRTVDAMLPSILLDRWWDTPTPLYRRSVCDAAGAWSDLKLEEDWEYDLRVACLGTRLVHCREFLADVRDHGENRLCKGSAHDPDRNRERARARRLMFQHVANLAASDHAPELNHFSRSLFLLSRQCGASGLPKESRELFKLALATRPAQARRPWDFWSYRIAALLVGWCLAGRAACWMDGWRPRGNVTEQPDLATQVVG